MDVDERERDTNIQQILSSNNNNLSTGGRIVESQSLSSDDEEELEDYYFGPREEEKETEEWGGELEEEREKEGGGEWAIETREKLSQLKKEMKRAYKEALAFRYSAQGFPSVLLSRKLTVKCLMHSVLRNEAKRVKAALAYVAAYASLPSDHKITATFQADDVIGIILPALIESNEWQALKILLETYEDIRKDCPGLVFDLIAFICNKCNFV